LRSTELDSVLFFVQIFGFLHVVAQDIEDGMAGGKKKHIGILGAGVVGKTLALGFANKGYPVTIGNRDSIALKESWEGAQHPNIACESYFKTAEQGQILVLAVPGRVAGAPLTECEIVHLNAKIIIDATNPISEHGPEKGVLKLFTEFDSSLMEQFQRLYPGARWVKAFNSVGSEYMVDPPFETRPTMFICGNDPRAKTEVSKILNEFGWDAEDMGPASSARAIEPLCMLWCLPGFLENKWNHAFKLLKDESK